MDMKRGLFVVAHAPERRVQPRYDYTPEGWGWLAMVLWFTVIVAVLWFVAALIS
jgi:hypothetical protein